MIDPLSRHWLPSRLASHLTHDHLAVPLRRGGHLSELLLPLPIRRRAAWTVLALLFTDLLGFGLLIPVAPFYAEQFGAAPAVVTLLSASYSLSQLLLLGFWGRMADRRGRRPALLAALALSAVGALSFAMAPSLGWLFAARLVAGAGAAKVGVAQAVMADASAPEDRAKAMGRVGMAIGLGMVGGPVLGAVLGQIHLLAPAWLAAGLAVVNLLAAWLWLAESRPPQPQPPQGTVSPAVTPRLRPLQAYVWIAGLLQAGFAMMEQALPLVLETVAAQQVGKQAAVRGASVRTAVVLVTAGLVLAAVQGALVGRLARRLGERRLLALGLLVLATGLATQAWAVQSFAIPWLLLNTTILAAGYALATPSLASLTSRAAPQLGQALALSRLQRAGALGRIAGPAVAGALLQITWGLPSWVAAALVLLALFGALRLPPQIHPSLTS